MTLPVLNCEVKRSSSVQKSRMSGIEKRIIASRSRPRPKAQPWRCSSSHLRSTSVWMTPQPSTSSQSPWKKISSSIDGSVNGK
jgi:hypothetical protein